MLLMKCIVYYLCYCCLGIDKAFLFDVVSKIYIATDASAVDMQTYELCCDMIDVVIDLSGTLINKSLWHLVLHHHCASSRLQYVIRFSVSIESDIFVCVLLVFLRFFS